MYTGNVWGIALLIGGFLATLIGFQLLVAAVFARSAESAARTLSERPIASAMLGVAALGAAVVAIAVLSLLGGPGKFTGGLIALGAAFPLVGGLATVSRLVGERMPSPADGGRPWRATLRGGVTCGLAFVVPLVGWFVVLPMALVFGTGAVALSLLAPAKVPDAVPDLPAAA